jgi:hypothetical protein
LSEDPRQTDYRDYRAAWAEQVVKRPYKRTWRAKAVKPPPGEIEADTAEEG